MELAEAAFRDAVTVLPEEPDYCVIEDWLQKVRDELYESADRAQR